MMRKLVLPFVSNIGIHGPVVQNFVSLRVSIRLCNNFTIICENPLQCIYDIHV